MRMQTTTCCDLPTALEFVVVLAAVKDLSLLVVLCHKSKDFLRSSSTSCKPGAGVAKTRLQLTGSNSSSVGGISS